MAFENLLLYRPEGTILFDNYTVKGYIPEAIRKNDWLLNPAKAKKDCWKWIVNHWQGLKDNEEWGENTHKFIADIKKVYKNEEVNKQGFTTKLRLYLDDEGIPTSEPRTVVNNVYKLTEDEYDYLNEKVYHLSLIPFEYHKELTEAPFHLEAIQSVDIVKESLSVDERLLQILIKITDDFLNYYRTQESGGKYIITKTKSGYNYIDSVSADLQTELLNANFYRIPTKVQEILRTESRKYKFASNVGMLARAIERIENPINLLPFVKEANTEVVDIFFNKLKSINIDTKISHEDLRWQVIEFAVQRNTGKNKYIDTVFGLIQHNSNKLPSSITRQYVNVGKNEYDTYVLDEDYKNDNQIIDSFFKCLPSPKEIDYFKGHYYNGKEDEVSTKDLFDRLSDQYLNIEQLRFCIDYALVNNDICDNLEIGKNVSLTAALDMILKNEFVGFDKHFKIPNVNLELQVYANRNILLKSEYLPDTLHKWIDNNPSSLNLFTRLKTYTDPYIAVRQALLDNTAYTDVASFADKDKKVDIDNCINWAIEKKLTYDYMSERYITMMAIIENLPSDYIVMPFLRYTGNVAPLKDGLEDPKPIFILERYQSGASFLSYYSWAGAQFQSRLKVSRKLANFLKEQIVYLYGDKELLFTHGFEKNARWNIQSSVDIKVFPELNDPIYQKWKISEGSKGITIHTSKEAISMNFNIMSSNECIFADRMHNSDFGYEPGKRVVIQQPNKDGLSLMKTIAKHIANMEFFKEPFIALQSLYVEEWESLQSNGDDKNGKGGKGNSNINISNSSLTEVQAQDVVDKITQETVKHLATVNDITKKMSGEELDKLNNVLKPIKEILDCLEKEDIQRLAEKKDKLMQMLDDLSEVEEEEKESQVRQTIGFIGELIYANYLDNMGKDYVHAAIEGKGDYDFEVKTDKKFVDVKTTLYSLKDGAAPFYLHRSQNVFMQKHPDSKYHIVRISLIDLNLKKSYEELRDTYGRDANPMENPYLRKRCEQIARKYWQGARIEEFDALSPEYSIRIELKKK